MPAPAPVPESDRFETLDLLRGFAVLGILVMNIQLFAMPYAAYANPHALGPASPRDVIIFSLATVLADSKFMTIFSMLFGAGVLLLTSRVEGRGGRPARMHYRRMFWLLVFGLIHAYLLWDGDILTLYALCGLLIYPARRLAPRTLFIAGLAVLAVGSAVLVALAWSLQFWPPEAVAEFADDVWQPSLGTIAREIETYQSGWLKQMPARAESSLSGLVFENPIWGLWRAAGMMLVGMALLKWRMLTGERSPLFYTRLAAIGLTCGVTLSAIGIAQSVATGWNLRDGLFLNTQWNYWGSLFTALGYIGLLLRVWQAGVARGLTRRLVAAGRMAFTCYITETLICTTIFYGHGFGLFGTVDRAGQFLVVLAVWVVLLIAAPLWLARFRYGPLEWLWRTLTYGRVEPIGRPGAAASAAAGS